MPDRLPERPLELDAWLEDLIPETEPWLDAQLGHPLRQRIVAMDVVQDAAIRFLKYSRITQIRTYEDCRKLFRRICSNTLRDLADYHTYKRRSIVREVELSAGMNVELSDLAPDLAAETAEDAALVHLALEQLSARDRSVLVLSHWTSLSYPKIGQCLGTSADTARIRHTRAMARFTVQVLNLRGNLP